MSMGQMTALADCPGPIVSGMVERFSKSFREVHDRLKSADDRAEVWKDAS